MIGQRSLQKPEELGRHRRIPDDFRKTKGLKDVPAKISRCPVCLRKQNIMALLRVSGKFGTVISAETSLPRKPNQNMDKNSFAACQTGEFRSELGTGTGNCASQFGFQFPDGCFCTAKQAVSVSEPPLCGAWNWEPTLGI